MKESLSLSVALITLNEEKRICKTLSSVSDIADEIIVIDSGSVDKTSDIASSFGAKVYHESWKGFVEQKNSLTSKCSCEWILYLDADEEVSDELKKSIIKAVREPYADGYNIKRRTYYLGKLLKYSWQPDIRLRLVRRDKNPLWVGEIVHEELKVDGSVSNLDGYIIHYSYMDIEDHFKKTIKYAELSAESYFRRGRKSSIFKILFNPVMSFIKLYILKGGILDGVQGLIAGVSAYVYSFLKYSMLWDKNRRDK